MANPSWLDLKTFVSGQLGADSGSTPTALRDKRINEARREYYNYRRWTFLQKSATLNFTAKVATLASDASDYNKKFDPIDVYKYVGTVKYQFSKVAYADVGYYATDQYVYAIDKQAGTVKINTTDATLTIDYTHLPADRDTATTGDDSTSEPTADITPIGYLAVAKWWLTSERKSGNYQLFRDEYREALAQAVVADTGSIPVRPMYPRNKRINTGYIGRN
jgi:hypothetical protein